MQPASFCDRTQMKRRSPLEARRETRCCALGWTRTRRTWPAADRRGGPGFLPAPDRGDRRRWRRPSSPTRPSSKPLARQGWQALREVIAAVPRGHPGDPGRQARRYRLHRRGVCPGGLRDAAAPMRSPLSPYLGRDSLEPFLADPERGVFLLCKTSNPGAAICRTLRSGWSRGGRLAVRSGGPAGRRPGTAQDNLGLVVGATHPEALAPGAPAGAGPVDPGAGRGRAGRRPGSRAAGRAARRWAGAAGPGLARRGAGGRPAPGGVELRDADQPAAQG